MANDTQCWHGRWGLDRCPEKGTWGWTPQAADKAGAAKNSMLRRSRWCKAHAHMDDTLLPEDTPDA
jgi:hypothetical protein